MNSLRRVALALFGFGFLIVAMGAAGGLLWALVDTKHAAKMLGSNFAVVGICEMAVTLYALGKGISLLSDSQKESQGKSNNVSHSFRK